MFPLPPPLQVETTLRASHRASLEVQEVKTAAVHVNQIVTLSIGNKTVSSGTFTLGMAIDAFPQYHVGGGSSNSSTQWSGTWTTTPIQYDAVDKTNSEQAGKTWWRSIVTAVTVATVGSSCVLILEVVFCLCFP